MEGLLGATIPELNPTGTLLIFLKVKNLLPVLYIRFTSLVLTTMSLVADSPTSTRMIWKKRWKKM